MDTSIVNLVSHQSADSRTSKIAKKLPNLEAKCYPDGRSECKLNLYTKRHSIMSSPKRTFHRMDKQTSPTKSKAVYVFDDDAFSGTAVRLERESKSSLDGKEYSNTVINLPANESLNYSVSPVKTKFIQNMVNLFDDTSQVSGERTHNKIQETFRLNGSGDTARTQKIGDPYLVEIPFPDSCGMFQECSSSRLCSDSENARNNVPTDDRSVRNRFRPSPAPKPKRKNLTSSVSPDGNNELLQLNNSTADEPRAAKNSDRNMNEFAANSTSAVFTNANQCCGLTQSSADTTIHGVQNMFDGVSDDLTKYSGTLDINAGIVHSDCVETGQSVDYCKEADEEGWVDVEFSEAVTKPTKKKPRKSKVRNTSSSGTKSLTTKKSLKQKVARNPSTKTADQPNLPKVIYVNDSTSEDNHGGHKNNSNNISLEGKDTKSQSQEKSNSFQSEEMGLSDAVQRLSLAHHRTPRINPTGKQRLDGVDSDEYEPPYEILPNRFAKSTKLTSPNMEPTYEVFSEQNDSATSARENLSHTTSVPIPPEKQFSDVPRLSPRTFRPPNMPSPLASPVLAPRKSSKGHIDTSKLSQIVPPPTPAMHSSGSNATPIPAPRVLPRLAVSSSVQPYTSNTPPLVLPRRVSSGATVQHSRSRRLPPPPIAEVPAAHADSTRGSVDLDTPVLPDRSFFHEPSGQFSTRGKRPSVGTLKGYESTCVNVDSANPSKRPLNPLLSKTISSQSMHDLRKPSLNLGSTLSLHVPAPAGDFLGGGQMSPSRSEGYLRQNDDGYLLMDSQRSSTSSRVSSTDSLNDLYVVQNSTVDDSNPDVPPRTRRAGQLENVVRRDNSYLDLMADEDYSKYAYLSLYDETEPLYQIYHQGVVVRNVLEQNRESDDDFDDDYDTLQEYVEHAKSCVSDILNRDSNVSNEPQDGDRVIQSLSTLEHAARLGTGFRKLWSDMPKVRESGLLDHMTPDERKLQESLFEIMSSEASYLRSMNLLVGHFMGMLSNDMDNKDKQPVLTKQDFNWLFSNSRAVRDTAIKMLEALENLWQEGCVLNPISLCRTITEVALEHYSVYITSCSNASYQERKLKELMERSSEFRYAVRQLENLSDCHSLPLSSFLALPMQRITRMPLLVSAMCRYLKPDDASSPDVTRCITVLQKVVKQCNEGARKMANLEQMHKLEKVLDFRSVKKLPLISQSRSLVKKGFLVHLINQPSGFLKKSKRTLFFFLFNDLLIITKKKGEKQYEVLEYCPRSHIHAEVIRDEDLPSLLPNGVPSGCPNLFSMVLIEKKHEYILSCESQNEQLRWIQAVTPVRQGDEEEEVVYVEWDCPQVQAVSRYIAKEPDELSLEESDIVNVLRKMNDGWFEGERIRDGERGWFPSSHTVEIQSAHIRSRNLRQHYQLTKKSAF